MAGRYLCNVNLRYNNRPAVLIERHLHVNFRDTCPRALFQLKLVPDLQELSLETR